MSLLTLRERLLSPETALEISPAITAASAPDLIPLKAPEPLVHFMNRTSFGIRQSEFIRANLSGLDAWTELQLNPESLDDSALEAAIASNLKSIAMSGTELMAAYPPADNKDIVVLSELRLATMLRQLYSLRQLKEVMVDFWTNHFSVDHPSSQTLRLSKTLDDRAIRQNALGKFSDLLFANAKGVAMQFYLDNYVNVKSAPQENYSRELMELHTLGVDGGYTETDVKEVARAFTGWGFARGNLQFFFNARNHDTDAKTVFGVKLAANRGLEDGEDVLKMLAEHSSTAKFIATKLVKRFVSDAPPANLVEQVANSFLRSGGEIKAMLRTIFSSVEFKASADLKVKRPNEFIIGALRVTEAAVSGSTYGRALNSRFEQLGQLYCAWPAPNGYPDSTGYWINTTAWLSRWNYAFALAEGTLDAGIKINAMALAGTAKTPDALVDGLAERILRRSLSSLDRATLVATAANGLAVDRSIAAELLPTRAAEVLALLLSSRYFTYR